LRESYRRVQSWAMYATNHDTQTVYTFDRSGHLGTIETEDEGSPVWTMTPLTWIVINTLGLGFWVVVGFLIARYV